MSDMRAASYRRSSMEKAEAVLFYVIMHSLQGTLSLSAQQLPFTQSPRVWAAHPNPQPTPHLSLLIRWPPPASPERRHSNLVLSLFSSSPGHSIANFLKNLPFQFSRALFSLNKTWLLQIESFASEFMLLLWATRTDFIHFFLFYFLI